jgi:hypothetical protein
MIDKDREPRLQLDDAEPFAIDSAEVQRDVEHSILTNVLREGAPVSLVAGARVTLFAGPNVVFVGKAIDEHHVLDLLSTESDDELKNYDSI